MRILTVCSSTRIFGTEIATLNLFSAFRRRGYEQLAVTSSWTDGEFSKRLAMLGISEVVLPLGGFAKPLSLQAISWTCNALAHAPILWLGWSRAIKAFRPDVLLITNAKQGLWFYPWLGTQPSFLIEHGMKAVSGANRWMYRRLQKKLAGVVAVSRFMVGHAQDLGVDPKLIHVVYNCYAASQVNVIKSATSSRIRIGITGQVSPHKGHDILFETAILLKKQGIDFEVVAFGTGEPNYLSDLSRRIKQAELLDYWKWMGYSKDQNQIYRSMDICVVPSCFDEPFGLVALEASMYGLPVIASRRGGLPEIVIDGETGFLVDSENPADLAQKITVLTADRALAHAMGQQGRERVLREFSEDRMIAGYESLFRMAGCVQA